MSGPAFPFRRALRVLSVWVALAATGLYVGRWALGARIASYLERATGLAVNVYSVSADWNGITARDVVVFGAPPFASEPLARIARLHVRLGGRAGFPFWRPSAVTADGVDVQYLSTGAIDNLRAHRPASVWSSGAAPIARPTFSIRDGRLTALIQPTAGGPRIALRTKSFSADDLAKQGSRITVGGLVVDVSDLLTLAVPETILVWPSSGGETSLHAAGASVSVAGGGLLLTGLRLDGTWSPAGAHLIAAESSSPFDGRSVRIGLHVDPGAIRADLAITDLPLAPLHPLVRRFGIDPSAALGNITATLTLEPGTQRLPFEVALDIQGLTMQHPGLDRSPWRNMRLPAHLLGEVDLAQLKATVAAGQIEILGIPLVFRGWSDLTAQSRGSWQVATPDGAPVACAGLPAQQPTQVREALRGLTLGGHMGLSASFIYDAAAWDNLALDVQVQPRCDVLSEPASLAAIAARLLRGAAPTEAEDVALPLGRYHRDFTPLTAMPPHLLAAFVTAEDGGFYRHHGFDMEMIRRALAHDIQVMSFARGASTLTQQLAKNLFLSPDRTLARKLEETVFAWRLDQVLTKPRALELYLNLIELGPGIRGVKQAARAYFGKAPGQLRPIESAHLAALTPNPQGFARRFRDGRVDDSWLLRLYDLLGMMKRNGRISATDVAAARVERLKLRKI